MQQIKIELDSNEKLILQFKTFEYLGASISLDLFAKSDKPYSEDHYQRVMNTFLEKYSDLQKHLYELMNLKGYKYPLNNLDFTIIDNLLTISKS